MGKAARRVRGESQKHIIRLLEGLSGRYSRWEIWQDFIVMSAIAPAAALKEADTPEPVIKKPQSEPAKIEFSSTKTGQLTLF